MTDSAFGPQVPGRPSHPDFGRLVEAVLWMDGESTEGGKTAAEVIAEFDFDPYSIAYMGHQRSLRAFDSHMTPNQQGAALWMEAFLVGLRMGRAEPR